jgi:hypothetical protein
MMQAQRATRAERKMPMWEETRAAVRRGWVCGGGVRGRAWRAGEGEVMYMARERDGDGLECVWIREDG